MPSISATTRIAGSVTQPSCSCARQRSEITAEACRPGGYFAISFFAQARFASLKAKLSGCFSARRRTDISARSAILVTLPSVNGAPTISQCISANADDLHPDRRLAS